MSYARILRWSLASLALAALFGCGGGAGDTEGPRAFLSGTAAYGEPLVDAAIVLTDSGGNTARTQADASGEFRVEITGLKPPLLLTARASVGGSARVYRALTLSDPAYGGEVRANVTPLTEAIVAMTSSDGRSPGEFTDPAKLAALDKSRLAKAQAALSTIIQDIAASVGDPGFDPLVSGFKANGLSPGDRILDIVKVYIDSRGVSLLSVAQPIDLTQPGAAPDAMVTVSDVLTASPARLPRPLFTEGGDFVDQAAAQRDACGTVRRRAQARVDRVSPPVALLGVCETIAP